MKSNTILLKLIDGSLVIGTRKIEYHNNSGTTITDIYKVIVGNDGSIDLHKFIFKQISIPTNGILYIVDEIPENILNLYQSKIQEV